MATYINYGVGDSEAVVQGAEWLQGFVQAQNGEAAEAKFLEDFNTAHSTQDPNTYDIGPVFELFVASTKGMFANIPEQRGDDRIREVESFFALVLSMLMQFEDEEHLKTATTRLIKLFSEDVEQQPELRLRLLMMLYNTFNDPKFAERYRIFKSIIDYASKAGLFDQVLPYLEYLENWMSDWDLSAVEKRALYLDISQYMRVLGKRNEAFAYLKQHHQLYKGESASVLESAPVVETSIQLVKDAVGLPSVILFDDIVAFDTMKALSKTKHAQLCKLCDVFLTGSVTDLRSFHEKNTKLFKEHDLSFEDAMAKIRLLALASLAHGKNELTLAMVAETLEEKEENVEPWVVRAISEGVVDGRIGQLNQKVFVKSAFQRTFEANEWDFLDTKLTSWIDNLEQVIKFIGEQKVLRENVSAGAAVPPVTA